MSYNTREENAEDLAHDSKLSVRIDNVREMILDNYGDLQKLVREIGSTCSKDEQYHKAKEALEQVAAAERKLGYVADSLRNSNL
jgi:uncharacterized protein HemY